MGGYLGIMRGALGGLLDFRGRMPRGAFWTYVLTLLVISMTAGQIGMSRTMTAMQPALQDYAATHPGDVQYSSGPGMQGVRISGPGTPDISHFFQLFITGMAIGTCIFLLLVAAAVVRRLHDSGRSGAWALMPVPFLLIAFTLMPRLFASAEPSMALFGLLFLNNLVYLACVGALIFLLCKQSDPAANRFGDPVVPG